MALFGLRLSVEKYEYMIMVQTFTELLLILSDVRVHQLIPITDEEFGPNSSVTSACVADPWILLVLDSGKVVVYEMNEKTKDADVHSKMSRIQVFDSLD